MSAKVYSRVARFRRLNELTENGDRNWVQRALEAGFFDQPHMIRDFREFTGHPPGSTVDQLVSHLGHQLVHETR